MLSAERNDALTRVSKGTPAGELLRRYWHPVAGLAELTGKRNRLRVRILGEDLVLFRTSSGELILIAEHCAHRGASLYHGFVEADGVRCPYHGIKYDARGGCLEVPFEPPNSPAKQEICLASYPVRALGGLVFAYLGPGEPPVLPRWDLLVSRHGKRSVHLLPPLHCNWLQIMENSADTTHTFYLHAHMMEVMGHPEKGAYYRRPIEGFDFEIERTPTSYGLRKVRVYGSNRGERERGHPILFPNALYVPHDGNVDVHWRVPIDDTHTRIVRLEFEPADREIEQGDEDVPVQYEPSFRNADGEYILDVNFAAQDAMAYESQGPIADRTKEYLLAADRGVVLYRKMLEEEMAAVAAGRDPAGVVRDPKLDVPIEIGVSRGQADYAREAASAPTREDNMISPLPVHLCGSVPLSSSRTVFEAVADALGERVRRYPDGETGDRLDWLQWQGQFLARSPDLEEFVSESPYRGKQIQYRPRASVALRDVRIGPLGYAETAIRSYDEFAELKRAGRIPNDVRFLVSLPTPLACSRVHIAAASVPALEPIYEAAMLREIAAMQTAIPKSELAIQWDVAVEFSILENPARSPIAEPFAGIVERLRRITNAIPEGIEAGIHLCYGDSGHKHFKEPEDASKLVAVANAVAAGVVRRLDWIHMPVPKNRADDAYFAPLDSLKLKPETELYFGLVHRTDGIEGARRRIAAARKVWPSFGIATECGFGRRPPEDVADLLRLHRDISDDR